MKFFSHRAAPSALAVGLTLLPIAAQAGSVSKSLEARLQEALGGASIVQLAATSNPANEDSAAQLLSASLPSGVTLRSASDAQVTEAVKAAVARDPKMAASIVRVAIVTKVPASERKAAAPRASHRRVRSYRDGKDLSQNSTYNPWVTAGVGAAQPRVVIAAVTQDANSFIYAVVFDAVSGSKDEAANIVKAAIAVAPAFAVTITQAALDALKDASPEIRREIIGVAQLAAPSQAGDLAALTPGGGAGGGGVLTAGGLGASSIGGAPAGAGIINPANIGAGEQTVNSPSTTP